MRKINVENLRPGQRYSQAVYILGNNMLVPAGLPLKRKDIDKLRDWGVVAVETDGTLVVETPAVTSTYVQTPTAKNNIATTEQNRSYSLGEVPKILSLPEVQEKKSVYRAYTELIDRLHGVFNQIEGGVSVENRSIDAIAARLLQAVRENRDQIIGFVLGGEVSGSELAKSSINVAILSTLIAIEMKLPNHKILQVCTGALLHDIGMLKLPEEIVRKNGKLTEVEVQRIQAHPLYAFKIICKEMLYPEDIGLVAIQHHERWDGEGYPRRLAGNDIDVGARIVSVADAFEAMVSVKPYRNSMMGYQAMKNLLSDNSRRFDPNVLKAFIKTMGIYPIGSIVLLNNGSVARVIEVHGDAPLRPKIKILIDEYGKAREGEACDDMDLLAEKSLFIARAIDPKEYVQAV